LNPWPPACKAGALPLRQIPISNENFRYQVDKCGVYESIRFFSWSNATAPRKSTGSKRGRGGDSGGSLTSFAGACGTREPRLNTETPEHAYAPCQKVRAAPLRCVRHPQNHRSVLTLREKFLRHICGACGTRGPRVKTQTPERADAPRRACGTFGVPAALAGPCVESKHRSVLARRVRTFAVPAATANRV
jgi:hypothetical protein